TVNGSCHGPEPWGVSWLTAMFMHGSWGHILGNMLFLAIFGKNVEDAFGSLRYLGFYLAGGFVAMMTQTAVTLLFGTHAAAQVPNLGASGAIAAVMGAYFVLHPTSRILTLVFIFPMKFPAWCFLGLWFLYQLVEGNFGLFSASANGGGTAFFAHVGGFIFGVLVAMYLTRARRIVPQDYDAALAAPASAAAGKEAAVAIDGSREARGTAGPPPARDTMRTAARAAVGVIAVVAIAFGLWKVRDLIILLLLALTFAAAMRPGVERLRRRGVPQSLAIAFFFVTVLGILGVFVWLAVPPAVHQGGGALSPP